MAAKNRVTINLDDEDYKDLSELSESLDVSLAWLGRRAFSDFLEKYRIGQVNKQSIFIRAENKKISLNGS